MNPRQSQKRRLERAGYLHVTGWLPIAYAKRVLEQAEMHRKDVERIAAESKPRGRPRKTSP